MPLYTRGGQSPRMDIKLVAMSNVIFCQVSLSILGYMESGGLPDMWNRSGQSEASKHFAVVLMSLSVLRGRKCFWYLFCRAASARLVA